MICDGWEGNTIDGKFPLLEYLSGWADRCVFLTVRQGTQKANIKLIPASGADADAHLAYWDTAKGLSHPYLLQLMESGRCNVLETDVVYLVTEPVHQFLSEILSHKMLEAWDVKPILEPVVDALMFLHEKGLGHGSLRPSNIVQVGAKWKLTSEKMASGEIVGRKPDVYDAPEVAAGELTPAADVWSLGMIVVEAFTQRTLPFGDEGQGDPAVPDSIPEPFRGIARGCLRREASKRIPVAEVKALLAGATAAPSGTQSDAGRTANKALLVPAAAEPVPVSSHKEEAAPEPADSFEEAEPVEFAPRSRMFTNLEDESESTGRKGSVGLAIVVLLVVIAILGVHGYRSGWFGPSQAQNAPAQSQSAPPAQAAQNEAGPGQTTPANGSQAAPANQPQSGSAGSGSAASSQPSSTPPQKKPQQAQTEQPDVSKPSEKAAKSAERPSTSQTANRQGEVLKRVMPNVEPGASAIMPRAVEVEIRVSVDENGSVSNVEYATRGPGNYFARKAHQAAEAWKFTAPEVDGQPAPSEWMLLFRFERHNIDVTATEIH